LRALTKPERQFLSGYWPFWARADQIAPDRDWTTWLVLGGRGAGKTRAGAEWVRAEVLDSLRRGDAEPPRIAFVAETMADARDVMVEGVSGLLTIHADGERPRFEPSRRRVSWPGGAVAYLFSAEDPDSLRGHQFSHAWCDETAKWRHPEAAWDMLQFALRLGACPRQVVTTTPRPIALLRRLLEDANTQVTRAPTSANAHNLSPAFLSAVVARYTGTRLGRQELEAEVLEDNPNALWRRDMIGRADGDVVENLIRIVVAVDPPATAHSRSNACGIVVAGIDAGGLGYVIADATTHGARPGQWAAAAIAEYHRHEADALVAEVNQGGDMVRAVIGQIDPAVPVRAVRATRGKWVRAEPVAALYEQGRIRHVGQLSDLEDQMCEFEPAGRAAGQSPDRVDALVWAMTELMLEGEGGAPRVRTI